jgi:hypothetical protein
VDAAAVCHDKKRHNNSNDKNNKTTTKRRIRIIGITIMRIIIRTLINN